MLARYKAESAAMKTRMLLFLLLICWFAQPLVASEPLEVSLVQLIANPKDYDGKVVRVIGFLRMELESSCIYLHQDDYNYSIFKNGLWIDASDEMLKRSAGLDQKYVAVVGTFNAKMTEHSGPWSGSIQQITRCQVRR